MTNKQSKSRVIEPQFLLMAYCNGYFPMADSKTGEIGWYSPDPRTIFDLNEFNVPRSLRLTIKKNLFEIRLNTRFEEVMRKCGEREETWISEDIIQSYVELHRLRFAHSVEAWKENKLVGGLYGVAIGGAFFGESMFSRERDASKVALVYLVERMKERGFELLDTQYSTPHLTRFGAKEIPREEYLERLKTAIKLSVSFM
ncbi:MAG: leucyl/phenylalanyl-tRNA--protein transferase [Ignavibacteriales bacterium]|nr:leucyl/phenylalanyl-tRNA--protein transferase [Ignavibacteriales bacterium]